ncbi:MAG: 3-deoxy-8-phosphooctulonate synthase [Deltaproteobacteria bacterium]|nr:3-deoxy-8-phosphooctulonate synthase [Deltaproteobacteria bacterium]
MRKVDIKGVTVGAGNPLVLIAGPCVIEDERTTLKTLEGLLKITGDLDVPFIFKASYDKANRTSIDSFRGPGLKKGLSLFRKIKRRYDCAVITDVHCRLECEAASEVVDCLQIPAFLCRQTDLLVEAGKTGVPVNIKKGQFMAPSAMAEAAKKVVSIGNRNILLTERGSSFGYNNLVVDFRSIPLMKETGFPVIFDATHSVQLPSARGKSSGGDRRMVSLLAAAAVAVGVDGVSMEVHPDPDKALSDGPNSIALKDVKKLVRELKELDLFARSGRIPVKR